MRTAAIFFTSLLLISFFKGKAQKAIPTGFVKATITLDNGDQLSGYVKDNIRKSSSVVYINETGEQKKVYEGRDINKLSFDSAQFMCINGDFFKVISTGKMNFLQKASNSAGNVYYNGADPVVSNGTEGSIGDYFVYSNKQLKLMNAKSLESFISADLTGCAEAIEKAKAINGDFSKLSEAVETFNRCAVK
jgi:hypothetical protein